MPPQKRRNTPKEKQDFRLENELSEPEWRVRSLSRKSLFNEESISRFEDQH